MDGLATTEARIRFAIARRRLVELRYAGTTRIAEPHDYGVKGGRERLLVFQLRGPARPRRKPVGWRMLDVSKIEALTVLDERFDGSRGASHGDHHAWDIVHARVT